MKLFYAHVLSKPNQVDVRQLGLGHPPALLPFDSLLFSHPVDAAWRRRIAEAHSTRYTPALSSSAIKPKTSDHNIERRSGRNRTVHEGETVVRIGEGGGGDTGSPAASSDRALTLGFIGHDFDEHPTAHMMAGVFLWQKRFEDDGRVLRSSDVGGVVPVAETVGTEASEEHVGMATNFTKRATSRRCCR